MPFAIRRLWRYTVFIFFQFHPSPRRRVEPADYGFLWRWAGSYERLKSR